MIGIVGGLTVWFSDENVLRKIPHWLVRLIPTVRLAEVTAAVAASVTGVQAAVRERQRVGCAMPPLSQRALAAAGLAGHDVHHCCLRRHPSPYSTFLSRHCRRLCLHSVCWSTSFRRLERSVRWSISLCCLASPPGSPSDPDVICPRRSAPAVHRAPCRCWRSRKSQARSSRAPQGRHRASARRSRRHVCAGARRRRD